jgi:hypothetical protein
LTPTWCTGHSHECLMYFYGETMNWICMNNIFYQIYVNISIFISIIFQDYLFNKTRNNKKRIVPKKKSLTIHCSYCSSSDAALEFLNMKCTSNTKNYWTQIFLIASILNHATDVLWENTLEILIQSNGSTQLFQKYY